MNVPQKVLDTVYGSKPEDWKQHSNGGGWVYKTATVETSAYLHPTSIVYGDAQVYGDARVYGNAWVYGDARVYGSAWVYGSAQVSGNAWVYGNARVYGNAQVYGSAQVYGNAWVASPPYIQGSRHALTLCSLTQIAVGCHVHDITEWLARYKAIGRAERYTAEQVAEYGRHLAYLAAIAKRLQTAAKKAAKKEAPSE